MLVLCHLGRWVRDFAARNREGPLAHLVAPLHGADEVNSLIGGPRPCAYPLPDQVIIHPIDQADTSTEPFPT